MVPEPVNINMQKTANLDTDRTLCIKIYSKWTKDLKVKDKIIKREETLDDLGLGNEILDKTEKAWFTKEKIDYLGNITVKNSCSMKNNEKTNHKIGGIFIKHISDRGLVSEKYNELLKLNNKKTNPILKIGRQRPHQRRYTEAE